MADGNGIGSELVDLLMGDQSKPINETSYLEGNDFIIGRYTQLNNAANINNGVWSEIIGVDHERGEYRLKLPNGGFERTGIHLAKDIRIEAPKSTTSSTLSETTISSTLLADNVLSAADYYKTEGARTLAHEAKEGSSAAISLMAKDMAPLVPEGSVLVPIPSKDGSATVTLGIAKALSELTGCPLADVIKGKPRNSIYDLKQEGSDTANLRSDFFEFKLAQEPPAGGIVLIDNVYDTGTTAKHAASLFKSSQVLVHSRVTPTENIKPYEKSSQATSPRIQDYGEHVAGAAKDRWGKFAAAMKSDFSDIAQQPLSKSFPVPNYEKLSENGVEKKTLAMIALIRAGLPARKPNHRVGLANWVNKVNRARQAVTELIEDKSGDVRNELLGSTMLLAQKSMLAVLDGIDVKNFAKASQYKVSNHSYSLMNGVEYPDNTKFYCLYDHKGDVNYDVSEQGFDQFLVKATDQISRDLSPTKPSKKKSRRRVAIDVYENIDTAEFKIGFPGGNGTLTVIKELGKTDKDSALQYLDLNYDELVSKLEKMRDLNMRSDTDTARVGPQYRAGNITVEDFAQTFGLRAVQWGNSTISSQKEAQEKLNSAYDAFMDMCEILNITPKAIGLDGSLAVAFGARGKGGGAKGGATSAHFEWNEVVINLTRKNGAGSLGHEWFHAFDNYISKQKEYGDKAASKRYGGHQTDGPFSHVSKSFIDGQWQEVSSLSRVEVLTAFEGLHSVINNNKYSTRANDLDGLFSRKEYWGKNSEKAARAFEKYLKDELAAKEYKNDFLVNIVDTESKEGHVYPSTVEMASMGIKSAFKDVFEILKERDIENKVALYRLDTSYDAVWDQWAGAIANDPDLFRYETIKGTNLEDILIEHGYTWGEDKLMLADFSESPASSHYADLKRVYTVSVNKGEQALVFETGDLVWLDVSGLASGHGNGSRFYQLVADFAYNSNKVFIGDPEGLSELAVVRRTENMMSSALRHGTTRHLGPHLNQLEAINDAGQRMPDVMRLNWTGDDRENLLTLLQTSYNNVRQHIPEIENVEYDFARSEYRVSGRVPSTDDNALRLAGFLNEAGIRIGRYGPEKVFQRRLSPVARALAGSATLQRAIITQTLLRESRVENQRQGVLKNVAELFAAAADSDSLKGILYKEAVSPADIAEEIHAHAAKVEAWIAETENNTGVPVQVVPTSSELPAHLRSNIGHGPGIYDMLARKPYIIASRIKNESHAIKTCLHEGLGHRGVIAFLKRNESSGGKAMIDVLDEIYEGVGAEEINRNLGEYKLDLSKLSDRREAVLEYIAILAERGEKAEMVASTVNASQEMMANMYPNLRWSRNDVLQMIDSSRAYMVNERVSDRVTELNPELQLSPEQYQEAYYSILKDAGGKLQSLLDKSTLVAWHGSPYIINDFSLEHIGSGEGAQAYGYGLYFAEDVAIAKPYKESIPKNRVTIKEGVYDLFEIRASLSSNKAQLAAFEYFEAAGNDWVQAQDLLHQDERHVSAGTRKVDLHDGVTASDVELAITELAGKIQPLPTGKLYKVNIDADRSHLLDFDATIEGQSQYVKDRIKQYLPGIGCTELMEDALPKWKSAYLELVGEIDGDINAVGDAINEIVFEDDGSSSAWSVITQYPVAMDPNDLHDMIDSAGRNLIGRPFTGEDVYYELINTGIASSEKAASEFLKGLGIPGIQYLDGKSRAEGEGNHNYVIFDDAIIEIVAAPENKTPINSSVASAWQAAKDSGLDLSQDARMLRARLSGFNTDTVFYHGSETRLDQFSKEHDAHYFTTNPEYDYIKAATSQPVYLQYKNPYMASSQSEVETLHSNPERIEKLKERGYDAVAWHEGSDVSVIVSGESYPKVAVFSPDQIRPVNATFAMDDSAPSLLHKLNDEAAVNGTAREILHFGLPMDRQSRLSRAQDQGYDTSRVLYHGSMSTFDSLVPQCIASAYGRGVYLTTSPEDASRYASKDVMVNMDIPGKADHLAATLGISYADAKEQLTAGPGHVTPVFAKVSNPIVVDNKGISLDGRKFVTFNDQRMQTMARFAGIEDAELFLKQLDRIQNNGSRYQDLVENLTGDRQADKALAISALLNSYNAGGFIRELAVTLNSSAIILRDGAATIPGNIDTGIEHVINLAGGSDIRSVNAAFNPEYQELPELLNRIDGANDALQNVFIKAAEKAGYKVKEIETNSGWIDARLDRDGNIDIAVRLSSGDLITEELRSEYLLDAGKFNEAYLVEFEVKESLRGSGVGTKAMKGLKGILKEIGTDVISLASTSEGQGRFYRSSGFNTSSEVGTLKYHSLSERALLAENSPVRFLFGG
ncbi:MAG: LPD1 domain-containing protein, partial [Colwellia sp.]